MSGLRGCLSSPGALRRQRLWGGAGPGRRGWPSRAAVQTIKGAAPAPAFFLDDAGGREFVAARRWPRRWRGGFYCRTGSRLPATSLRRPGPSRAPRHRLRFWWPWWSRTPRLTPHPPVASRRHDRRGGPWLRSRVVGPWPVACPSSGDAAAAEFERPKRANAANSCPVSDVPLWMRTEACVKHGFPFFSREFAGWKRCSWTGCWGPGEEGDASS
ncbi:uncharacterized protein PS065_015184 [Dugong dugon]